MSASLDFAQTLARLLDGLGASGDAARAFLLDADPLAPGRIGMEVLEEMFIRAARQSGDAAIALRTGHRFRVGGLGRTGAVYTYARDLADAVWLNARYQKLAMDLGTPRLVSRDGRPTMEFAAHHPTDTDGARARFRHCHAMLMGAYVTSYRWLSWGAGEALVSATIPVPANDALREAAGALLRVPVSFDSAVGSLEFTPGITDAPLLTADSEKRARAVALLDGLLEGELNAQSARAALDAAIGGALDSGGATLATVAARLGLSESALRRRLREHGEGFRNRLDAVRRRRMVHGFIEQKTLSEIAQSLGYNDQAAFNRAVRRWYGVPPGQWTPDLPLRGATDDAAD